MKKHIKKWIKDEKRIIKLMYRKGLLDFDIDELYWESYHPSKYKYDVSYGRIPTEYYPEVHFSQIDYWGECDEYGVSDTVQEGLYWDNIIGEVHDYDGIPPSTYKKKTRKDLIVYLSGLPTVINDSKINKVLNRGFNN